MAWLLTHTAIVLSTSSAFAIAAAAKWYGAQRIPHDIFLFAFESRRLSPQQSTVLAAAGVSTVLPLNLGCGCGFVDGSWISAADGGVSRGVDVS